MVRGLGRGIVLVALFFSTPGWANSNLTAPSGAPEKLTINEFDERVYQLADARYGATIDRITLYLTVFAILVGGGWFFSYMQGKENLKELAERHNKAVSDLEQLADKYNEAKEKMQKEEKEFADVLRYANAISVKQKLFDPQFEGSKSGDEIVGKRLDIIGKMDKYTKEDVFFKAAVLFRAGQYEDAIAMLEQILLSSSLSPEERMKALYQIGYCYQMLRESDKAIANYEQACGIQSESAEGKHLRAKAYTNMGACFIKQKKDPKEGRKRLLLALDNDSGIVHTWEGLAASYIDERNLTAAQKCLDDAAAMGMESDTLQFNQVCVYSLTGQFNKAEQGIMELMRSEGLKEGNLQDPDLANLFEEKPQLKEKVKQYFQQHLRKC
ncbi:MAG: tetratricopeptide repeat protein [Sphaerochaetaceae bacterium]|nr:tetratricopeptide repeat protein [Sphaerochaetaceae bacterium]